VNPTQLHVLLELALVLGKLTLLSIGSSATVIGQMQREVVAHGWMTAAEFTQAFGLAQATPGSGSLVIIPVGYRAAGLPGALVAFAAFYVPTFILAVLITGVWQRVRFSLWPNAIRIAVLPVALGLVLAAIYTLGRASVQTLPGFMLVVVVVVACLRTRLPMAVIMGGAAAVGAVVLR
jgi:chromate transporter